MNNRDSPRCAFVSFLVMIGNICTVLLFLLLPAAVIRLCGKVKVLEKIGPVLVLYILGVVIGNTLRPQAMAQIQDVLSSAMVPVAIPLMLFGCRFTRTGSRSSVLALVTGMAAVILTVIAGYFLFGRNIPDGYKVGAMLSGVYTGGTVNLAALQAMLDVPEETFIMVNSCDMLVSFLYLTFLMATGIRLFRRVLPTESVQSDENSDENGEKIKLRFKDILVLLGIDAAIIGVSAGLGLLAGDAWFMTVLILMLTTLGIAASFLPAVRKRPQAYDIGYYCICIFSVVVASMADFTKLDFSGSLNTLLYLTFVIFASLFLQLLFSRLFRIDADTTIISSVTYICSPPFVPMMAMTMKNRSVIAPGLAIGVVGYAAGNYIGFLIAGLLRQF